jgi:hypothetical protein
MITSSRGWMKGLNAGDRPAEGELVFAVLSRRVVRAGARVGSTVSVRG